MPIRETANLRSGIRYKDRLILERLGKVKLEHREIETGKWEDPLRYLPICVCAL